MRQKSLAYAPEIKLYLAYAPEIKLYKHNCI